MTSEVTTVANIGYDGKLIHIECDSSNGLPNLLIVGMGNKAIEEAKERIRSAIKNTNLDFPRKRIVLNLAPADLPKDGSSFDVPMALAILLVSNQLPREAIENTVFLGELALDGSIRPVKGVIGAVETAKNAGITKVIVPIENVSQATLIPGMQIVGVQSLRQLYLHLKQEETLSFASYELDRRKPRQREASISLSDIYGQEQPKRALLIAAAGQHNILMNGPPGSGKTMLARALLSLLPPPTPEEIIAITKLHDLAGELQEEVILERPFRNPHHTASATAMIGGGTHPKPGEISLAHKGVLFLDELPEYPHSVLESLRQPLEDKQVCIARTHHKVTYPADFMLVATQNPCPCGYLGDATKECVCSLLQIQNYQRKVSGPLLDRIDIHLQVTRVEHRKSCSARNQTNLALVMQMLLPQKSVRTNGLALPFFAMQT